MIKEFIIEDLGRFIPNEFSNPDNVLEVLASHEWVKETLWGPDGMVQAIICFKPYWGRNWIGFLLLASKVHRRTPILLKAHLHTMMRKLNAKRFQTDSVATDCLYKWHEWLGFTWEGCRKKFMFGRDYDMWALMREGA